MPDLIIIDGGKGQLSSVVEVMKNYNYTNDLISLAKREEEVFKPNKSIPIMLKKGSFSLRLIQLARDEAHRFAITFHRELRGKSLKSSLSQIEGIGEKKVKSLLKHFKSVENIAKASEKELSTVEGIGESLAKIIFDYYHKDVVK